ncbi:hypothetical protein AUEXF2481DRAFT_80988 [Aureobasidium subglaciale EXF-2481]|uniref:Uncharacterized protein n=1 Tax=Aureobasidium subglaciale (strain EXF-2481) TaxID=1043005 RepID=A0A074Y8Z9_AURSE|nr:uncharacterized protein AUEXF2481DRAFT_80988 [Aureobasidium subglaciale EXF-2481]KAI5208295.1 hypothetical protein E4T38_02809 [Aureobasidium subglaciale]KAI5227198.1 hypothetical protein E4T40_02751 [Aureobasidium subglaciale]KAI5230531.1 hypothetical protein E4T41_02808 [Aureobasidium subglaciale]KAI5264947.1 hypothetical protein E4T46_02586 [Aureobasidium subglaciale]KEQ94215.1 hypothetical protein AUEXF2481DRAFT_80988 [Aureobasidium subglaciale EXF-2481]
MSSNTGISPHATSFTHSYATATALAASGSPTDLSASAKAMSTHYLPSLTSFTLGTTTTIASCTEATTGTLSHLQKLVLAGVGTDIRMIRLAVKEISECAAAVFVTWELVVDGLSQVEAEKLGKKARGWRWRNCYGYRRMTRKGEDGEEEEVVVKEGFEYIVSDDEVGELIKRVPKYFEL